MKRPKKQRGTSERTRITVRLHREDWERLHQLAVLESTSMQQLALDGLSREMIRRGMPGFVARED